MLIAVAAGTPLGPAATAALLSPAAPGPSRNRGIRHGTAAGRAAEAGRGGRETGPVASSG
jgi:hypothetical protein